ncbi:MAG: hypothetical protein ABIH42_01940 [Planctomycetota bacterium]
MAYAYTPGLTVTKNTVIRRKRILPLRGIVLKKKDDVVSAEDVVAKTDLPGSVETINIINRLGVSPQDIHEYMLKKEGETVTENESIAQTKPLISWFKTVVKSPVAGTIEKISEVTGQVLIRQKPQPVEVMAYIDGKVVEVFEQEGVTVQTKASFIQGIFGIGHETSGTLRIMINNPEEEIDINKIDQSCKDAIIISGSIITTELIKKANQFGVRGIISGGIDAKTIKDYLGYDLGVAITGSEDIPTTVVITEGFGKIRMATRTFDLLCECAGKKAALSGATQIRAGVIRPEIIIPVTETSSAAEIPERESIKSGDPVRMIREPYFGQIGKVLELPPDLVKIESEAKVRIMSVELQDGEKITVPRANVELIES